LIESGAGTASGFSDADFKQAGALIVYDRQNIWAASNIIIKVKEPSLDELSFLNRGWPLFNPNAIIFTFFHFPANPNLKKIICEKGIKTIPYENIQLADGSRPILRAMSKIAAEMSVDAASHWLRKENGGKGILLRDARTVVIGCEGALGQKAFELLIERWAHVIGFDRPEKIQSLTDDYSGFRYEKRSFSEEELAKALKTADLVICATAQKGEGAPKLIARDMLKLMQAGSVIVDPTVDEGGCCETSRPTTHDNPVFVEEGVIHYCVANMPGAVPRSSTPALVKETFPFILEVANKGWEKALKENEILARAAMIN
jgi:alanine dehydrogenase